MQYVFDLPMLQWIIRDCDMTFVTFLTVCFQQDLLHWVQDKKEVEVVDLILKIRNKLVSA